MRAHIYKINLGLLVLIVIIALARPVFAGNQNFLINAAQALNISEIEALSDNENRILRLSSPWGSQ